MFHFRALAEPHSNLPMLARNAFSPVTLDMAARARGQFVVAVGEEPRSTFTSSAETLRGNRFQRWLEGLLPQLKNRRLRSWLVAQMPADLDPAIARLARRLSVENYCFLRNLFAHTPDLKKQRDILAVLGCFATALSTVELDDLAMFLSAIVTDSPTTLENGDLKNQSVFAMFWVELLSGHAYNREMLAGLALTTPSQALGECIVTFLGANRAGNDDAVDKLNLLLQEKINLVSAPVDLRPEAAMEKITKALYEKLVETKFIPYIESPDFLRYFPEGYSYPPGGHRHERMLHVRPKAFTRLRALLKMPMQVKQGLQYALNEEDIKKLMRVLMLEECLQMMCLHEGFHKPSTEQVKALLNLWVRDLQLSVPSLAQPSPHGPWRFNELCCAYMSREGSISLREDGQLSDEGPVPGDQGLMLRLGIRCVGERDLRQPRDSNDWRDYEVDFEIDFTFCGMVGQIFNITLNRTELWPLLPLPRHVFD